ncbi:hypothetical protein GP486_004849 [Trichoglossum hirsutum]|uniref:Uncharacterized protein n=1 Tax=Trichoglossum hirsutum TaxID=265104 RepID=A0A9P8LA52_9PEZI|nr:hypothetical protein GP486_004849 [Trichoglossum hirsutum]
MSYFIDYTFATRTVQNPDGSLPTTLPSDATFGTGPGTFHDLDLPKAARLGNSGPIQIDISTVEIINEDKFNVSVVFGLDANFNGAQTLVESERLPFKIGLVGTQSAVKLVGLVHTMARAGWTGTDVFSSPVITPGWHLIQLYFDTDNLCLFLDGNTEGWCHGFDGGTGIIGISQTVKTVIVGGKDASTRFRGQLAALQVGFDVPIEVEPQMDELGQSPQWYITSKVETSRSAFDMGEPMSAAVFDAPIMTWSQDYTGGRVMFHSTPNVACTLRGAILERYKRLPDATRIALGYPSTDEEGAAGIGAKKNRFQGGGIYWSSATGAFEVVGQPYIHYEQTGEGTHWGMPTEAPQNIGGGTSQRFQSATLLYRTDSASAHFITGAIRDAYYATGGLSVWGFPLDEEIAVPDIKDGNADRVVHVNHFEFGDFWWSQKTGAHPTRGDFRRKWEEIGGPKSSLGLPVTDEVGIPGGGLAVGYEHGVITWHGSFETVKIIPPFKIYIGTINTQNSEGAFMGQNDLYFMATINDGNVTAFSQRFPSSGDFGGQDILTFNTELSALLLPNPTRDITLVLDIWESDDGAPFGGGDDHMGIWRKTLNSSNAWGLLEHDGILNSGSFSLVNNITAAIHPQADASTLTESNKFWGADARNRGTDPIDYQTYGEAFTNVDPNPQIQDPLDWLDKAFYEAITKHIASGGNCFGMALEAIYSRKNASLFSLPIDRFNDWNTVQHQFNVKHQYQVGASAVWWFVGQFLSGYTHSPVRVFNETRDAFNTGNNPVLCISQNADFSGAPHCVMPVAWDSGSNPWKMTIHDPNFPRELRIITVDNNTWRYEGRSVYAGTEWSGGRMYYMPWSVLVNRPRTPVWDAIMLLVAGTISILGSDTHTVSITGLNGADLSAHSPRAIRDLQDGRTLDGYFLNAPILMGGNQVGELTFSRGSRPMRAVTIASDINRSAVQNLLTRNPPIRLEPHLSLSALEARLAPLMPTNDFHHTFRGNEGGGTHRQLIKSGNTILSTTSPMAAGETAHIKVQAFGTVNSNLTLAHSKPKTHEIALMQRLGMSRNSVSMKFNLTATAAGTIMLAPKPGLARLNLHSQGAKVSAAKLEMTSMMNGVVNTLRFDLLKAGESVLEERLQLKIPMGSRQQKISAKVMDPAGTGKVIRTRAILGAQVQTPIGLGHFGGIGGGVIIPGLNEAGH